MKKAIRVLCLLLCIAIFVSLFAACGKENKPSGSSSNVTAEGVHC